MLWIIIIIKVLMIAKICQSLTIIPTTNKYNDKYQKPKELRKKYGLNNSSNFKIKNINHGNLTHESSTIAKSQITQPYEVALKSRLLATDEPYKSGMISNILSIVQPKQLAYDGQEPASNIYPVKYKYENSHHKVLSKLRTGIEPVTAAASLKIKVLPKTQETLKFVNNTTQQPWLSYNNKVYHVNKAISNQSSYSPFIRKQRHSKSAHYDDDKLIEHNFTDEIRDDNKDNDYGEDFNRTASSIKQPSTSSHEIRYLHDIFLNYPKDHHVNYGHIELSPSLFEKRFESLKAGNRYKGEVIWLDNTGGYTQHYWNMAQGKL